MKYLFYIAMSIWFLSCVFTGSDKKANDQTSESTYKEKGQLIVSETFGTLSSNLMKAMQDGGIPHAIDYCNIHAMPLTDSLAELYHAEIKRTSLQVRNQKNKPSTKEEEMLKRYNEYLANGNDLNPMVEQDGEQVHYYAPIRIQPGCLNCHGSIDNMSDYEHILNRYPEDLAIGYKDGDLRGMWSVTFNNKSK